MKAVIVCLVFLAAAAVYAHDAHHKGKNSDYLIYIYFVPKLDFIISGFSFLSDVVMLFFVFETKRTPF